MKPITSSAAPAAPTIGKPMQVLSPLTPARLPPRRARWPRRLFMLTILGSAAAVAYFYRAPLLTLVRPYISGAAAPAVGSPQLYTVHRGALNIIIAEDGKLHGVQNYTVMLGINGKITWLAPVGAQVKKGDLLVTVDKKPYEDSRVTAVDDLQTARQSLVITQQAVPIAESKAESGVATARTQRDEAALALKLYTTIEVPKKLNEFETQSNDVRSKLQDAQKSLNTNQSQLDEHLEDDDQKKSFQQQVDLSKQTISSFQKTINTLDAQRKLFRAYTYPQDLKSKKQALANAELQVKTAEISGKSDVLAKKAEVDKAANRITQLQNQIKRFDDQIAKCSVYSPADGLVYYGSPDMNRYGYTADQVRVGVDWYQNAPIMTIPDLSSFKVDVGIPEVYRGRLAVGQPARVSLEAIPDLVLTGNLETLTSVARSRVQWDPSSPQVFDASITLHQTDPRMVAGMSALVQITTATYENALYVPIEGVFSDEGRTVVYLHRTGAVPEKVPVKTGDANDHFVLIAAGLNPGDQILLSRPDTFFTPPDFLDRLQAVNDVAPPMPVVPPLRATPDAPTSDAAPTTSAAATAPAAAVTRPSTAPATAPTTTSSEGQNHGSGADRH